ncbi:MAG: FAD:protein FMN transferase [Candidatus Dormibacteraeota bacterium]|nr:FAD:protein FMN transferase [Candidatus Dormibacteraeota bacterium]
MLATSDFPALGTGARVITLEPQTLEAATAAVERVLREVDLTCSRFRSDSEVTRLNQAAGVPTRVSPLLFLAIETALRVSRMTAGAVDPTVGAAMRIIGYDRDFARLPADGAFTVAIRPVPGYERIRLDRLSSAVTLQPEVEIDLGATAKALAADLCAAAGIAAGASGILVSLGGDIAVAGEVPTDGWPILIAEDHAAPADAGGEVIAITAGAVATSSTTVRRWRQGGQPRHHIVDPATGAPARVHWRTVSVVAASCVDANAAATASIVWGEAAVTWLEENGLAARLVAANGEVNRLNGWPRATVGG